MVVTYFVYLQVYIFHMLQDSKFEHFLPVMDTYINNHFSAAYVFRYTRANKIRHRLVLSFRELQGRTSIPIQINNDVYITIMLADTICLESKSASQVP